MKKIRYLFLILLFPLPVFSQDPYQARLSISGAVAELGVSPSEEIWVATAAGNVYTTKRIGEVWKIGPFGSLDPFQFHTGGHFERINFFSEDTLMLSGFIQENDQQDFVYWSANHGKTWEKVRFGTSSWLNAAYINPHGKAWMSGNSQSIFYTQDRGQAWQQFPIISPDLNLRISTIHFARDEKTGLVGSFWNVLYRTRNNCQSWEKLPTPLSQKKYQPLSQEERPDIRKIRMFGKYYLVNQQGRVFITRCDSIEWLFLPQVLDFEVSESEKLYTINHDLSVELFDSTFSSLWKSSRPMEAESVAIAVRNESLFALTSQDLYKMSPQEFRRVALMTDGISIPEPDLKVQYQGVSYGFDNRDILQYDKKRKQWFRFMTLEFPVAHATLFNNQLLVTDGTLNQHYLVRQDQKTLEQYTLPTDLLPVELTKVTQFHLEKGSQGCFHSSNARRSYRRKKNQFVLDKKTTTPFLPKMKREMEAGIIDQLVHVLDESRQSQVRLSELEITPRDVTAFQKFMDQEQQRIQKAGIDRFAFDNLYVFPGEYTDFAFYKRVSDSLFTLSDEVVDQASWQADGHWSTTTNWRRVIFVLANGKRLTVENSDDKPNYLYTPWLVDYEGVKFKTNSIQFGQLLNELTQGEFFTETTRDKNYAIFKIADYLYQKKIREK